jgi:hypothetical protein
MNYYPVFRNYYLLPPEKGVNGALYEPGLDYPEKRACLPLNRPAGEMPGRENSGLFFSTIQVEENPYRNLFGSTIIS